jgi:hypothetical protein
MQPSTSTSDPNFTINIFFNWRKNHIHILLLHLPKFGDPNLKFGYPRKDRDTWAQFRQRSTHNFYVRKFHVQLFCAYVLCLYYTGARLLAQKLRVERW